MCLSPQTSQLPSMVLSLKDQAFRPQLLPRPRQLGTVPGLLAEAAAFMAVFGSWQPQARLWPWCGQERDPGFPNQKSCP